MKPRERALGSTVKELSEARHRVSVSLGLKEHNGNSTGSRRSAASVLLHRADRGKRNRRPDGARLALCIEGGGMRGIISSGMLVALAEMDLLRYFDAVYGVSAGAVSAAYCFARQVSVGLSVYLDHINNRRFFAFHRFPYGDLLDLDYFTNRVLRTTCRIDADVLGACGVNLRAVVLDTITGKACTLPLSGNLEAVLMVLRASVTIAGCVRPARACLGGRFADAAVVDPLGIYSARREGHSHLIVLLSRPSSRPPRRHGLLEKMILGPRLEAWSKCVTQLVLERDRTYQRSIEHLRQRSSSASRSIALVEPAASIRTFETSRPRLVAAFQLGYETAVKAVESWSLSR